MPFNLICIEFPILWIHFVCIWIWLSKFREFWFAHMIYNACSYRVTQHIDRGAETIPRKKIWLFSLQSTLLWHNVAPLCHVLPLEDSLMLHFLISFNN